MMPDHRVNDSITSIEVDGHVGVAVVAMPAIQVDTASARRHFATGSTSIDESEQRDSGAATPLPSRYRPALSNVKMPELDDSLLETGIQAMHKWSLKFVAPELEAQYVLLTVRQCYHRLVLRTVAACGLNLVVLVPVLQLMVSSAHLPVATMCVIIISLLLGALQLALVALQSWPTARTWWELEVYVSNVLLIVPMFASLAACVSDGLAPTMQKCTLVYPTIMPLLPLLFAVVAPYTSTVTTRVSWYASSAVAATYWVAALIAMLVTRSDTDTVLLVGILMFVNIWFSAAVNHSVDRTTRLSLWLGVLRKQTHLELERANSARAQHARRNRSYLSFAKASGQVMYELTWHDCAFQSIIGATEDIMGRPRRVLVGQPHLHLVHPEDVGPVSAAMAAWMQRAEMQAVSEPLVLRFRRQRPDLTYSWMEMLAVVETDAATGRVIVASERNVTQEQEQREALELERQSRAAEAAARQVHEETLGYVCHELRNPLHVIIASTELLEGSKDTAFSAGDLQTLRAVCASSKQMRTLVDDILDVERLRAGRLPLRHVPFSPAALVHTTAQHHKSFACVSIFVDVGPDVPTFVCAPQDRIQQILNNALTNAGKFCNRGAIRIRVHRGAASDTLRFEVRNSGVAPSLNLQTSVMYGESSLSITTSEDGRQVKGSGLGLRISATLVASMGGTLHFENLPVISVIPDIVEPTEATFWFELACPPCDAPPALPPRPPSPVRLANALRVLYVDDDRMNRTVARQMMTQLGCTCSVLEDGSMVTPEVAQDFDVVLLDIIMQHENGDQTLARLQRLRAADVPLPVMIAVTGNTDASSVQAYKTAGFSQVLCKPFQREELCRVLAGIVPRRVDV